uniref:Uncharacterized protein n=1 Tax=Timema monikensis TaxID=170555 RepID=A0A7R9HQJ9_9NEOP|nr:unnamed protein product [Timema monikensis]
MSAASISSNNRPRTPGYEPRGPGFDSRLEPWVVCWGKKELLDKSPRPQLCLKVVCRGKEELLAKYPRSQLCLKVVCRGKKELLAKSPRSQLCLKVVCRVYIHLQRKLAGGFGGGALNEQSEFSYKTNVRRNNISKAGCKDRAPYPALVCQRVVGGTEEGTRDCNLSGFRGRVLDDGVGMLASYPGALQSNTELYSLLPLLVIMTYRKGEVGVGGGERIGLTRFPSNHPNISPHQQVVCWGMKELLAKSPRSQLCGKVVCWGNKELLAKSPRSQLGLKVVCWGKKDLLATSTNQRCQTCILFEGRLTTRKRENDNAVSPTVATRFPQR